MTPAAVIPLCAALVNVTSGVVHVAISRAPGWRVARVSAAIALTAGLYGASSIPYGFDGLHASVYLAAARVTYVAAVLHAIAWIVFAFGGQDASPRAMPRPVWWLVAAMAVSAAVFAASGAHLRPDVTTVDVAWAGVRYRYPVATPAGDVFGLAVTATMVLVMWRLVARVRAGERELRWHVGGFAVFLACAVDEVLVANRTIVFLSLADFGMVAVVLPLTITAIRRVVADARRLADLSGHLEDEVKERTEERDRAESALVESERLAALGRLAAGVGHEINNPLTYMQLALAEVRRHADEADVPPAVRDAVASVEDGAHRIEKVVEGLRSYSRPHEAFGPLDLRDVARAALQMAGPQIDGGAAVVTGLEEVPLVRGDEARLVQAVVNLLVNAVQAVAGRSDGRVVVRTFPAGDGGAAISVADNGPGIPKELLARVSEPYFTTRARLGGRGLGLFVTRGVVDAHGGRLRFDSEAGGGTTAAIVLPSLEAGPARAAAVAGPASGEPFALIQPRARVLLVDDEPLLVRMLSRALRRSWEVATALNARDALAVLDAQPVDAIVCDLMMPGMSGIEFAEEVWRTRPALRGRVLFLTGGAFGAAAEAFLARPDVRHLVKPVALEALNGALREILSAGEAAPGASGAGGAGAGPAAGD